MRHSLRLTLALITLSFFATTLRAQSSTAADSLRATELAFAKSVADKDLDQFKAFLAQDAVFASGPTLRGPEAIAQAWSYYFAPGAPPLLWCPTRVEVLGSGELGMTTGPYETLAKSENDGTRRVRGVFFSVWRRQSDGSWRIVFDSGTPPTAVTADTPAGLDCSSD